MALGNLIISIKAEDMASHVIKSVGDTIKSFASDLAHMAGIQIADGIIEATKALGAFQMELELTDIAFTQMIKGADRGMHSMEEYTKVARAFRNELHDLAAETPFSFMSVNKAARQMMAYGFALHDVVPMLRNIGDAAAAFGGSPVVIDRIVRALGQIRTYGRLKGQELLQLTEAGVPAHQILAEELGLTREQLSRIADQQIPAEDAIKAILTGIQKRYEGMMEVQSRTLKGSIEAIRDNFLIVATQLTEDVYSEFSSGIQNFRRNLDQWKNMTRVAGWRGMFGRAAFYDNEGREVNVSKMSKEDLQDKIKNGELRREFVTDRYLDKKGNLADLTNLSQEEIAFKEAKGDITKQGPLIPLDWQQTIFAFGDYILELVKRIKELGNAFGRLWNTLFGGTNGLSDVGYAIFRMINGFIILGTTILDVANAFVSFIDTMLEAGSTGRFLQAVIIGIVSAIEMAAIVNVIEKFAMLAATFQIVIGFAGIIGVQFGAMVGIAYLVGQSSTDAATGVLAVGTALMIIANRAMIAGAAIMAWNAILGVMRSIVTGVTAVWSALVTIFATVRTTVLALHAVWVGFSASLVVGTTLAGALHGAFVALNIIFGGSRLVQIALTAATVATTVALEGLTLAYTATVAVAEACIAVFHILRGTYVAVGGVTAIFTLTIQGATLATEIFSGAITVLAAVMTAFRAKVLLIIAIIGTVVVVLYNAFDAIKQAINSLFTAIANAFASLINWFLEKLSSWSKSAYDGFVDTFAAIGKSVKELLGSVFSGLWDDTSNFVKGILQRLGPLGKLIEEIGTKVSNAWEAASSPDGSMLGKFESFVKEFAGIKDMSKLDEHTDSYYTPLNIPSGESKKDKQDKTKNQLQQWEKEVSLGEYWAHVSITLDGVGKSIDDLLPKFFQASNSFKHLSGDVDEFIKYAESLKGNGTNNSVFYDVGNVNFVPKYGQPVVYEGSDGKQHVGIYMGDGKVRTGADEVISSFEKVFVSANMKSDELGNDLTKSFEQIINGNWEGKYWKRQGNWTNIEDLTPAAKQGLNFISWIYNQQTGSELVVNHGKDGAHTENSYHYSGEAVDLSDWVNSAVGSITTDSGVKGYLVDYMLDILNSVGVGNQFENQSVGNQHIHANVGQFNRALAFDLFKQMSGESFSSNISSSNNQSLRDWADKISGGMSDAVFESLARNSKELGLDVRHVIATAVAESFGNQNEISPAGAIGVMQLMPSTAASLGVDPWDMEQNVSGGVKYLANQYKAFGNWDLAHAAYNAGPGAVKKYGGVPPYSETQQYVSKINNYLQSAPNDIESVGQQMVQTFKEVAKVNTDALKNISDLKNARFFDIDTATGGETGKIKIQDQSKEQKKVLDEFYKKQNQINKAVQEYNTYMGASKLKLDEINGNFTEYREKVLETRAEFIKTAEQAQKLVGQGLSRSDADKMVARAKEVAEAILKEFERVRKIEFEIDFKTSQAKIAELNHDIEKSLILQKEAETLQLDINAFEAGKKILKDASAIPEIMAEYAKIRNTGQSFREFMQDLLSVDTPFTETNSKFADFIKNNEGLLEKWVTFVDAKSQESKQKFDLLGKTIYSRTAESYTNQGNLQGLIGYVRSPEATEQRQLEQSFNVHQEWCNRVIELYRVMGNEVDLAMQTMHKSMIENGTSAIMDFIKGTKSAKEAFKDFALSVMEDILKLTVRNALTQAFSFMIPAKAEGGRVKAGETVLVGEKGPELLSVTSSSNALNNPKSQIVGKDGPELITIPYTGFIISNEDVGKMLGYYSDSNPIGYMIDGFRAEGGNVKKDKAYIVGERGPEVFSPSTSGNIFSNEQLNSTLSNLDKISRSGAMSSVDDDTPKQTIPPVVVNLENRSNTEMNAQAESNFDGEKWVISVIMDAVNRNVNGLRNVIGNVSSRRN